MSLFKSRIQLLQCLILTNQIFSISSSSITSTHLTFTLIPYHEINLEDAESSDKYIFVFI